MATYDTDWNHLARRFLEMEKEKLRSNNPPATPISVYWGGKVYVGSIQELLPEYSREIVLLSKATFPAHLLLVQALNNVDQGRLELTADSGLDLIGRQHVLRRIDKRLMLMNPEQTEYARTHLPPVVEI